MDITSGSCVNILIIDCGNINAGIENIIEVKMERIKFNKWLKRIPSSSIGGG